MQEKLQVLRTALGLEDATAISQEQKNISISSESSENVSDPTEPQDPDEGDGAQGHARLGPDPSTIAEVLKAAISYPPVTVHADLRIDWGRVHGTVETKILGQPVYKKEVGHDRKQETPKRRQNCGRGRSGWKAQR